MTRNRRPAISRILILASFLFHAASLLLFFLIILPRDLYFESTYVFLFFLTVSMSLALAMFLVREKIPFLVLLILRAGALFAIQYPSRNGYPTIQMILLWILLVETSVYEDFPVNLIFNALILLGCVASRVFHYFFVERSLADFLHELILYVLSGAVVAAVSGFLTFYRERMIAFGKEVQRMDSVVADLAKAQMGYLEFARTAEERSTMSERKRLSSELHDTIGYTFTNLMMMLAAAQDLADADREKMKDLLHSALDQTRQGLYETRKTLYMLREQEEGKKPPFLSAVHNLIEMFEKATGVRVKPEYTNFPMKCGDETESALYHFIQEGMTNSFLHGKARNLQILFWCDEEIYQVILRDDGLGVEKITEGIGMRGMRERLGKLGGTLSMRNLPKGFEIIAQIPVTG